ncbi:MAG: caspase family protein, partial [Acidobacteriota bacterium]
IWEAASGRLIRRLERQAGYFALSPDGETLVAARRSGGIGILDLASGRWIRTLSRRVPPIGGVAVSKDGRRVAAGGLRQIVIDPHPNQREAPRWRSSEPLNPVELAHARLLEEVWIWDLTNASLVQHLPAGDVLCFSDDGRLLAAKEGYKTSVWEIASGKKLQTFNTSAGLDTATFSPDGRRLYVGGGSRGRFRRGFPGRLHAWDVESGGLLWSAELSSEATGLTVDPDDPQWLVVVGSRSVGPVIDTRSGEIAKESSALMSSSFGDFYGREMRRRELSCDAFSPNGIHCAASGPGDQIRILDMASGSEVAQFPMRRDFSATGVFADDETLMIVDAGGVLWMLDISASQRLGFVPIMDEGDYVVFTEDGHYLSTGKGYSAVAVALENRAFSFEQFDLRLNRPDRVLEKLPGSDPKLRNAYLRAYQKRLEILGAREEELSESFHVPTVEITNLADLPRATAEPALRLGIRARDEKVPLAQLQLRVNGVPVLGRRGLDLDPKGVVEREVEVLLEAGQNRIQASALNAEGSESLRSTWTVEHTPDAPPPKALVLVTLGVSEFENPRMNLKYAAKDARDVAQFFSSGSPFQEVRTLTLLDRDVTRDNLPQIRRFLMNSRTGDQAMIFVASHGLLDENLDYYIASWDTDAADPAQRGIPYEELENLVDGIPARNRLILIDACHAGEVDTDKSNVRLARNSSGTVRSRGVQVLSPKRLGIESSFEMMRTLFVDLRRTTGAVVIAAANGREAALEGRDWRNGVFTYSLLQGLESGAADLDGDGAVHASELKRHVERQVVELTRGQQRPTTRRENHERDFRLW